MHIKSYMDKIIENGKQEDMYMLGKIMIDLIYDLKTSKPYWYKNIEYSMHKIAVGHTIGEHFARKWVCSMQNKDGSVGGHWSYEETDSVKKQLNLNYDCWEFYAVMNYMYSLHCKQNADLNYYVELVKDWFEDKSATECKTLKFYIYTIQ